MTSLTPPTWHPALAGVLVAAAVGYGLATRGVARRRDWCRLLAALAVAWLACAWPLGDLAAHVSLSAAVVQRLALMLCVAPLLVAALPAARVAAWTRPRAVDAVVRCVEHPGVAIAFVTVVGTLTLLPVVVSFGASSTGGNAVVLLATLGCGVVLWLPVLGTAPGARRLSFVAKGGYLLAASLVVTSLSFVWIFSRHVLYPSFSHQQAILGLSPIDDQQLAGYVAKLGAYLPLWLVAFVYFVRAGDGGQETSGTLLWSDVERELERADRRRGPAPER